MGITTLLAVASVVVVGILIGILAKYMPLTGDPAGRMQLWKACFLLAYLIATTSIALYVVAQLWAAEPQEKPSASIEEPKCEGVAPSAPPSITALDPAEIYIGSSRATIRILGCNFSKDIRVTFGGAERLPQVVDAHQLVVPLVNSDFGAPGDVVVGITPGAGTVPAAPAQAKVLQVKSGYLIKGDLYLLGTAYSISQEVRLLLLVLLTGALGSCVYGLKSLADYIGDKMLHESWFTYYLVQPFKGAGIALIFYVVLRAGFLAGVNADAKAVNPYGISAIAALVGVFSDKAFGKLREVFTTMFNSKDTRTGAIDK
jgi:hypothetical protein